MTPRLSRLALALGFSLLALSGALAQPDKDKRPPGKKGKEKVEEPEDFRRFLKKPTTPLEYWNALQFERDVGRYDLAARYLRGLVGLLDKRPADDDLVRIVDKDGLTAVLSLRNVRRWSRDEKENKQALDDVETFIKAVTDAVRKRRSDPERIRENIKTLTATPEERAYATRELYKSGPYVVPYFLDALRDAEPRERLVLLQALGRMGPQTVDPLLAALDSRDTQLKLDILDILRRNHARDAERIVPHLWFLSASKTQPESVRKRATRALADFLDLPPSRLPPAKEKLTREAERYYRHRVDFANPSAVTVWRWDGRNVVEGWGKSRTVPASEAEEYYGLRFARQALALDPTYRPAQVLALSLAVDKAVGRAGLAKPLSSTDPDVYDLLARSDADLLVDVLERALEERRTGVALATVQALGARAEVRAKRPLRKGEPALVRALDYPDRRVQFAAAEALLRIPGPPARKTGPRIVEIFARALAARTNSTGEARKVIVAIRDDEWRSRVRASVEKAGADPVPVATGRDLMRRLRAASDVDAILLESALPDPTLPYLLGQLRADVDSARLPVLLAAVPESRASRDARARYGKALQRLELIREKTRPYDDAVRELEAEKAAKVKALEASKTIDPETRTESLRRLDARYAELKADVGRSYPDAVVLGRDVPRLEKDIQAALQTYDREARFREEALRRYVERSPNVTVVRATLLEEPDLLRQTLLTRLDEAGGALSPAEQKDYAERAVRHLADLALGTPPGYDVRPASGAILDALRAGKLSPEGQLDAIAAASRLPGTRAQTELAHVVLDRGRKTEVRLAAARALVRHIRSGTPALAGAEVRSLRELAAQPKLDPALKGAVSLVLGALESGDRATGERLREYRPTPAGVIPPPGEKKK
jgi:hypothetical protein